MTVVAKRLKTIYMSKSTTMIAGESEDTVAVNSHTWLEDVTVIGVMLRTAIVAGGVGWDSGECSTLAEVSRVAKFQDPGTFIAFCNHLQCFEATVGINANQTMVGPGQARHTIMFPEGYGVDMDEGTTIYLNQTYKNEMANNHSCSAGAIVFYVER